MITVKFKVNRIELDVIVKDINVKTLVSGDKSAWVKFETLRPEDVDKLKAILDKREVIITIEYL